MRCGSAARGSLNGFEQPIRTACFPNHSWQIVRQRVWGSHFTVIRYLRIVTDGCRARPCFQEQFSARRTETPSFCHVMLRRRADTQELGTSRDAIDTCLAKSDRATPSSFSNDPQKTRVTTSNRKTPSLINGCTTLRSRLRSQPRISKSILSSLRPARIKPLHRDTGA